MRKGSNIKNDAKKAWIEYSQAIVNKFDFPKGSSIAAVGLREMLETSSEENIKNFTTWVQERTSKLKEV